MRPLLLASSSRYRRSLLERLGLPFSFVDPDVDERAEPGELPAALAARLAWLKASAGATGAARDAIVIGADQVASFKGEQLGKPGSRGATLLQLEACQGETVIFHTAVAVLDASSKRWLEHVDVTRVSFLRRSAAEIARYVDREPAFDCAGGFKAEGLGISLFESIESKDPTALIGLPLIWLGASLRELGMDPLGVTG
jgi:7-methyl-GTP pyrophosphatase